MKVLDLRSTARKVWFRAQRRAPSPWWCRPSDRAVDAVQGWRVSRRAEPGPGPLVVSVGNLAVGGTGKTPVVVRLAADLAARGHTGCVLTRGYGSALAGPLVVEADNGRAGDEARMMAAQLSTCGWPVVQSRRRSAGLSWLKQQEQIPHVVLLEDGHQTRVGRHLDILIVDTWRQGSRGLEVLTGPVLPFGPWRESARGADRAGILLVETEDPPEQAVGGRQVAGFGRRLVLPGMPAGSGDWAALSALARPERFEDDAATALGRPPLFAVRCDDHSPYSEALLERITSALREAGSPCTVTTRKDWTKLAGLWPGDLPVVVGDQETLWTGTPTLPELVGERLAEAAVARP